MGTRCRGSSSGGSGLFREPLPEELPGESNERLDLSMRLLFAPDDLRILSVEEDDGSGKEVDLLIVCSGGGAFLPPSGLSIGIAEKSKW